MWRIRRFFRIEGMMETTVPTVPYVYNRNSAVQSHLSMIFNNHKLISFSLIGF